MKSVLISIQPKWLEKICRGKKTVEVRKTKPKLETPFRCYIYCTANKNGAYDLLEIHTADGKICKANGKVIGEFVCDRIVDIPYSQYFVDYYHTMPQYDLDATCLDMGHIDEYLLSKDGYGWHITDLVVYDEPMELGEFKRWVDRSKGQRYHEDMLYLQTPPQSWCYVEVTE